MTRFQGQGVGKGINWDEQPLGVKNDREIADMLGCTVSNVFRARKRRGIPAVVGPWGPSKKEGEIVTKKKRPDPLPDVRGVLLKPCDQCGGARVIKGGGVCPACLGQGMVKANQ